MGGLGAPAASDGTEGLRRERAAMAAGLAAVTVLAWIYLWLCSSMPEASTAAVNGPAFAAQLLVVFAMWTVMMAAMMLPGATPAILLYLSMVRKNRERGIALPMAWTFTAAYLLMWTAFSVVATLVQAGLEQAAAMRPDLDSATRAIGGIALLAAGAYQLTPLKRSCLRGCRNPLEFFLTHWRTGPGGAFRMGLEHGAYCVGCCWALMLLLFVAGVMNMAWVALITVFVLIEKLYPGEALIARASSALLMLCGAWVLATL